MSTFASRFRELREKTKGMTQDDIADALGVSRSTIAGYESEHKNRVPRQETLEKIADYFNVSIDYLLGRTDNPDLPKWKFRDVRAYIQGQKSQKTEVTSPIEIPDGSHTMEIQTLQDYYRSGNAVLAPIVSEIACGDPIFAEDRVIDYLPINPLIVNIHDGPYVWVKAKGDSMMGAGIVDGSLVLLRIQPTVDNGDIAAVCIDKEMATLKRIFFTTDGVMLKPENANYKSETYAPERIRIVGRAMSHLSPMI